MMKFGEPMSRRSAAVTRGYPLRRVPCVIHYRVCDACNVSAWDTRFFAIASQKCNKRPYTYMDRPERRSVWCRIDAALLEDIRLIFTVLSRCKGREIGIFWPTVYLC